MNEKIKALIQLIGIVAIFAVVIFAFQKVSGFAFDYSDELIKPPADGKLFPNEYGDSFGMVNALFSALAFAGVIVAIILQTKELTAQRKEMQTQNEMLDLQREALDEQRKEMIEMQRVQLFHTRFNQLLDKQNQNKAAEIEIAELEYLSDFMKRETGRYANENESGNEFESLALIASKFQELSFDFSRIELAAKELSANQLWERITEVMTLCTITSYSALRQSEVFPAIEIPLKKCQRMTNRIRLEMSKIDFESIQPRRKKFDNNRLEQILKQVNNVLSDQKYNVKRIDGELTKELSSRIGDIIDELENHFADFFDS